MATTIVGIFDDYTTAQQAARELTSLGVDKSNIDLTRNDTKTGYTNYSGKTSADYSSGEGLGDKVSNFFENLFGGDVDESDRSTYAESVRRGSTLLTARVEDNMVDRAADVLNSSGAVDVDRRAAAYQSTGYKQFDASAPAYTEEQATTERTAYANQGTNQDSVAVPVIEEQLTVGKRAVQRGAVRIHQRVTEKPVEETVTLREEQVNVERRPVNRDVSEADKTAFRQGTVEVTTTGEEAVVAKDARVVEEVLINKNLVERDETVRDTVRRTDVDVEDVTNTTTTKTKGKGQ